MIANRAVKEPFPFPCAVDMLVMSTGQPRKLTAIACHKTTKMQDEQRQRGGKLGDMSKT